MNSYKLGLLGYGTVGQGIKVVLDKRGEYLKETIGIDFKISKVAVRNLDAPRQEPIDREIMTDVAMDVVEDPEIDIVVEVMGGVEESYKLLTRAMESNKHVVTANKAVVSAYFEELSNLAKKQGVLFLYEASVGGGIPAIKPLYNLATLNEITEVKGILNGTSNYILSKMTSEGADYIDVLKEAQELGYAEADPYDDVEGVDAMRKLRILSSIAFKQPVKEEDILMDGISNIGSTDIDSLKELGYIVKLLAKSWVEKDTIKSIVQPTAIKDGSYFSMVNDAYNNVTVKGDMVGIVRLFGPGAGMLPTAHAVLSDCIDVALNNTHPYEYKENVNLPVDSDSIAGKYYVRTEKDISDIVEQDLGDRKFVTKRTSYTQLKSRLSDTDPVVRIEE